MLKKGYSLIELMVVLSIASLMIGLGLARYYYYNEEIKLKSDARKLIEVIDIAKKKTTAADLFAPCSNFSGYRITTTTNNYSLFFCCSSLCTTTVNSYPLATNVSIISGIGDIDFPPLMRSINITINTIRLKNSTINQCLDIFLTPIGLVNLDETMVSC